MTTVMIVDDEEFIHQVLERILELGGHSVVRKAYNGAQALEQFAKLIPPPDVILMDHRMPVLDGITATKEILKIDAFAKIFFISADDSVRQKAIDSGALEFFLKPITFADLKAALKRHTDQQ